MKLPAIAAALALVLPLAGATKPNIVFIIADDLGCFGQQKIRTPVLDKLAAEGIRFTQHYSGSTVCAPSRSTLMTGLDTGSTWLRGNVARDTLIVFTSDNGPHYEGGFNPAMFNSAGPLRGGKRDLYEGGIRVPTIAHWPAGISKPGVSDHVSAFWDFLSTACSLAGSDAPAGLHGISSAPTLTGKGGQRTHDFLYWEFHERDTRRALRQGDWKLVQHAMAKNGHPELYHLGQDPAETKDLAGQDPGRVAAMLKIMNGHRKPSPIFPNKALDR